MPPSNHSIVDSGGDDSSSITGTSRSRINIRPQFSNAVRNHDRRVKKHDKKIRESVKRKDLIFASISNSSLDIELSDHEEGNEGAEDEDDSLHAASDHLVAARPKTHRQSSYNNHSYTSGIDSSSSHSGRSSHNRRRPSESYRRRGSVTKYSIEAKDVQPRSWKHLQDSTDYGSSNYGEEERMKVKPQHRRRGGVTKYAMTEVHSKTVQPTKLLNERTPHRKSLPTPPDNSSLRNLMSEPALLADVSEFEGFDVLKTKTTDDLDSKPPASPTTPKSSSSSSSSCTARRRSKSSSEKHSSRRRSGSSTSSKTKGDGTKTKRKSTTKKKHRDSVKESLAPKGGVCFGQVTVYEFPCVLGDNPAVSSGVPIMMGRRNVDEMTTDLEIYERFYKGPKRVGKRRLSIPLERRSQMLLAAGYSLNDIADAAIEVMRIKKERADSLKSQGWERMNFFMQAAASRVFHRLTLAGAKPNVVLDAEPVIQGAKTA